MLIGFVYDIERLRRQRRAQFLLDPLTYSSQFPTPPCEARAPRAHAIVIPLHDIIFA
jgi:hypothetical protein